MPLDILRRGPTIRDGVWRFVWCGSAWLPGFPMRNVFHNLFRQFSPKRAVSTVRDSWGKPSADLEFRLALEKIARKAWAKPVSNGSSHFHFKPDILLIRDEEVLNKALAALYSHARVWADGLDIPFRVPPLRISQTRRNAGQFNCDEEGWLTIDLSAEFLDVPKAIWLILAHETCHHILSLSGLADNYDTTRNERLTDMAMFVCGFGDLARAGQTFVRRTESGYLSTHLGYFKPCEYAYAYHWVVAVRCANQFAGMDGEHPYYPQLKGDCAVSDDPASRLRELIPDAAARKRLFDYFQSKYPAEASKQTTERVIESIERDRR